MPINLQAVGAGASEGLDNALQRMLLEQKMKQQEESDASREAEVSRHNLATEDTANRWHQLQAMDTQARIRESEAAHKDQSLNRQQDNGRALAESIPGGTVIPEDDSAVTQMRSAGLSPILRGLKARPAVDVGPLQPEDTGAAVPVDSVLKMSTAAQKEKGLADERANTEADRRQAHDLAMENKQPHQPDPQPQILYGPDGKIHAIQFSGGKSREIPVDDGLTKTNPIDPKQAGMRKTGLEAVSRVEQDIDAAAAAGLIGPAAGRIYEQFAKLGTTGDPAKDHLIGRLKSDILLTKMHVDAGIGGTRAAASPLLLKNWEQLALNSSPDLLKGYTSAIRDDMTGPSGGAGGTGKPLSAEDLLKKYGG